MSQANEGSGVSRRSVLIAGMAADPLLARANAAFSAAAARSATTTSAILTSAMGCLRTLALALRSPGSSLSGNSELRSDLTSALDWLLAHKDGGSASSNDNWFDFEIGIPLEGPLSSSAGASFVARFAK